jgi:hypothetical protein
MAGEFSQVGAQLALNYVTGKAVPVATTRTTYLALLTSAPNDASSIANLAEVNTSGYARQAVSWTSASAANPVVVTNSTAVTFGPFSSAMAFPALYAALVSAGSGSSGDFLFWWQLEFAIQAGQNESVQFAIGALEIDLT